MKEPYKSIQWWNKQKKVPRNSPITCKGLSPTSKLKWEILIIKKKKASSYYTRSVKTCAVCVSEKLLIMKHNLISPTHRVPPTLTKGQMPEINVSKWGNTYWVNFTDNMCRVCDVMANSIISLHRSQLPRHRSYTVFD